MSDKKPNLTTWDMHSPDFEVYSFSEDYVNSTPVHFHTGFYELYLFLAGDIIYNIDCFQYKLSPGDLLLIPPGVMHWPIIKNGFIPYERCFLWVNADYLHKLGGESIELDSCFHKPDFGYVYHMDEASTAQFLSLCQMAMKTEPLNVPNRTIKRESLIRLIMLMINDMTGKPEMLKENSKWKDSIVWHVTEYINEHLNSTDLSIEMLAGLFGSNASSLSKAFRKQTGMSLHQYVIRQRMNHAQELLSRGATPFEVYPQVGYTDYSTFYRNYKMVFGVSPSAGFPKNND